MITHYFVTIAGNVAFSPHTHSARLIARRWGGCKG